MSPFYRLRITVILILTAMLLLVRATHGETTDGTAWAGSFHSAPSDPTTLLVELRPAEGGYCGIFKLGDRTFPATAKNDSTARNRLLGDFVVGVEHFPFSATLELDVLALTTGKTTYKLTREPGVPAGALSLRPQLLFDTFANTDAVSILVPDGWRMDGRVTWDLTRVTVCGIDLTVTDPASLNAIRMYPRQVFFAGVRESYIRNFSNGPLGPRQAERIAQQTMPEGGDYGNPVKGEIRQMPATPGDYVRQFFIPRFRADLVQAKDLRVVSETDLPKFASAKAAERAKQRGQGGGIDAKAASIRITYSSTDGASIEERIVCVLSSVQVGPRGFEVTVWDSETFSSRTKAGDMEKAEPLFSSIQESVTVQPKWFGFLLEINAMLLKAQNDATTQRGLAGEAQTRQLRDAAREQSQKQTDSIREKFAAQQSAKAESHRQFMNYVNNSRDMTVPSTGSRINLPSGYKFNYRSNSGRIISTNDPTYQPPADPATSWELLK